MNKKTVMIASGVVSLILATSACGGERYEYQVSGPVEGQQIDYDCPGEDIAMDAVAFVSGKGKGSGGGGSSVKKKTDSDSGDSDSGSKSDKKADTKKSEDKAQDPAAKPSTTTSPRPANPQGSTPSASRSASATPSPVKNKGVKLKSKPEKPEKLKARKLPKLKYKFKPKGCETEYEIFVWGKGGDLYEQDVRKADYDKCLAAKVKAGQKAKLFPLCTKG